MKKNILQFFGIFLITIFAPALVNASSQSSNEYIDYLKKNENMVELSNKVEQEMLKYDGKYPSYYGGMYIANNAENLVLQIVKKNIPDAQSNNFSSYEKITKMDNAIIIQYVDNSYTELQNAYEQINNYYESFDYKVNNSEFNEYLGHYIDIKSNSIIVSVDNENAIMKSIYSDLAKKALETKFKKEVLNTNIVKFESGQKPNDESTLKPGQTIVVADGVCSMGYRVRLNGKPGYITAGHCFSGVNVTTTGGTVKKWQNSGRIDAAFVETTSSYTLSDTLAHPKNGISTLDDSATPVLRVGGAIAHDGTISGYQSGTIKSLSYSVNMNGIAFTNLISTDYVSANGDSGGPVFVPRSSGVALLAGVHKGRINDNTKVFSASDYIYTAFGYSLY